MECLTLDAGEEIYEVDGRASGIDLDRISQVDERKDSCWSARDRFCSEISGRGRS